jgi:Tol biopolymer transport system component
MVVEVIDECIPPARLLLEGGLSAKAKRLHSRAGLPGVDSHSPYLSADGGRVMFLSNASGLPQIYTINTDGGEARQVTRDNSGVLSAAMSDDGRM